MAVFEQGFPIPVPDGGGTSLVNPKIVTLPVHGPVKKGDMLCVAENMYGGSAQAFTVTDGERGYTRSLGTVEYNAIRSFNMQSSTEIRRASAVKVLKSENGVDFILFLWVEYTGSLYVLKAQVVTFDGYNIKTPYGSYTLVSDFKVQYGNGLLSIRDTSKAGVFTVFYNAYVAWGSYGGTSAAIAISVSDSFSISVVCSQTLLNLLPMQEGKNNFQPAGDDTYIVLSNFNSTTDNFMKVVKYNTDTNTFTVGSNYQFATGSYGVSNIGFCVRKDGTVVICWSDASSPTTYFVRIATISGTAVSFGASLSSVYGFEPAPVLQLGYEDCIVAYVNRSPYNYVETWRVTGSAITVVASRISESGMPYEPGMAGFNPQFKLAISGDDRETVYFDRLTGYASHSGIVAYSADTAKAFVSMSADQGMYDSSSQSYSVPATRNALNGLTPSISRKTGRIYVASSSYIGSYYRQELIVYTHRCSSTLQALEDQPLASINYIRCVELNPIGWKGLS